MAVGSAVFAQLIAMCPYTLQWAALSRPYCPFQWGDLNTSNTLYLWRTRVLNPNSISIGSAIFAGLTTVADRLTDRQQITLLDL